jgi:hypothetical protein
VPGTANTDQERLGVGDARRVRAAGRPGDRGDGVLIRS